VIFLDTSAIYALADRRDEQHARAVGLHREVLASDDALVLHSYVLVESFALLHRRLGLALAREVDRELERVSTVVVDRSLHRRAAARLRSGSGGRISLVDAVSFLLMEDRKLTTAFAFDPDFERAGFRLLGDSG
jgi:predicted nucleic acid-binding protein